MKKIWEKIKEHPIYSKVAAGLILAALLAILNIIFSWNIFSSNFIVQKWIVPTWLFICIGAVFIIVLWMAIILNFRKSNGVANNNSQHTTTNQQAYPEKVRVIKEYTKPHQYIIKNNIVRHIPDPVTFNYLGQLHGFDWGSSKEIAPDDFKKFSIGSALPSILPYCQAILEKEIKKEVKYESPYYWKMQDGKKDGPFCQCCYDKDHSLIRLQESVRGYWECKVCSNNYTDSNYQPPTPGSNRGIL
ncbi:MAG: hypothetical protein CVU51_04155 [Deltaproteobacteria bacterium HGW-Deltaproteobacteria-1]|jgi:membrane protein implicated in regulation of membrane protease activity|nr:MAG: hypothetical protein CVU51_04155 [Deltaproteobacteria bacterium HGW-Deltaproteobacteria-1]